MKRSDRQYYLIMAYINHMPLRKERIKRIYQHVFSGIEEEC